MMMLLGSVRVWRVLLLLMLLLCRILLLQKLLRCGVECSLILRHRCVLWRWLRLVARLTCEPLLLLVRLIGGLLH